ncbi:hypothetical protein TPA0906_37790 [Streptomyces olivaceus]|nr:hypothetical protein TPA0905_08110 [Streptomyces olivaceus]GHJ01914.1 hypothetical protein TPA0906_37790 [Streptomyces olivaceus]
MSTRGGPSRRSPEFEGQLQRELREASTPVDRADRGNQPIERRVDTISKQYQVGSARKSAPHTGSAQVSTTHGGSTQYSSTQGSGQDGSDGGGAPWES